MLKDAKEFSGVNMKQGPGSLCQPCCCRTVTSLHLKWNKVSTVTISSQVPTEVTLPQKTGEEMFLLCVCWVFLPQENYFRLNPIPSHSSTSMGRHGSLCLQCSCARTSLCVSSFLEESWGKDLQAESSAQGSTSSITRLRCVPKPDMDGVCLTMRKPNCLYFSVGKGT